jgi:hypothetical protein
LFKTFQLPRKVLLLHRVFQLSCLHQSHVLVFGFLLLLLNELFIIEIKVAQTNPILGRALGPIILAGDGILDIGDAYGFFNLHAAGIIFRVRPAPRVGAEQP